VTYEPKGKQVDIITSTAPVLIVLGGAGTGKTTTAVAAARAHLEAADRQLLAARRAAMASGKRTRGSSLYQVGLVIKWVWSGVAG
jgi:DNA helicase-2/ATP-dependent DNA helicase PcrA